LNVGVVALGSRDLVIHRVNDNAASAIEGPARRR